MQMRLTILLGTLVVAASSSVFASSAIAGGGPSSPGAGSVNATPTSPNVPVSPRTFGIEAAPATLTPNIPVSPRTLGIDAPTGTPSRLETIPNLFERAFFNESGDFFRNRSPQRQAEFIIGPGFPDLELERDAELVEDIYRDLLEQQVASDPVLRTPDLPNPYDTSIRLLPASRRFVGPNEGYLGPVEGSEFFFESPLPR
jgi:hypothetical protein